MGKASRLKKRRRTIQTPRVALAAPERVVTARPRDASAPTDGANPVVVLLSMLLDRGWVEQPPDGVLSQLWFEFPHTLTDYAPQGPSDPDGIHPATVLVCARSSDADGVLRDADVLQDVEIHVELAGRDPGAACPEHAAPAPRTFPLDTTGLTDLAGQLDEIEQHLASWPDMIACADGPGACR
ncbi:hypothetical protein [Amycolatopsis thermoflava]|uniref:hypothetical protein n=1 Tax=Amycolatopsis thermoflava TaxID=84480 RepID=UPI0036534C00